eukprot:452774-Rhodomonas_salina.1
MSAAGATALVPALQACAALSTLDARANRLPADTGLLFLESLDARASSPTIEVCALLLAGCVSDSPRVDSHRSVWHAKRARPRLSPASFHGTCSGVKHACSCAHPLAQSLAHSLTR